ncbi:hypothetical protein KI387_030189, partial [Taxus chinensis]
MEEDPVSEKKFNVKDEIVINLENNVEFLLKSSIKEHTSDSTTGLKEEISTMDSKIKALEEKHDYVAMHNSTLDLMQ